MRSREKGAPRQCFCPSACSPSHNAAASLRFYQQAPKLGTIHNRLGRRAVLDRGIAAAVNVEVEGADEGVSVIDGDGADVGHSLDLGGDLLNLLVGHGETELADTRLDGVPARQARCEVDVAGQAEVGRVEDLVGARVVQDGLGVDAGLVSEGAEAGDGVVEGCVDLHGLGDQVLDLWS